MKFRILYFLLFIFSQLSGQEKLVNLGNFSSLEVSAGIKVELVKASENKAVVTGANKGAVNFSIDKNTLVIKTARAILPKEDNTLVKIFYKDLREVEAGRKSTIEFSGRVKQEKLQLTIGEGAYIFANMDVNQLAANASTGGKVDLVGKAENQVIKIKSEGKFSGENLIGNNVTVEIEQGGNANIFSKKIVKASIRAGGHIYIYGNPKQVDEKVAYGGVIKKIN